jgi:DNA-binding GntR family transcriptional regulator
MRNPVTQKKDSMVDAAYTQIRRRILDVDWPPGFQVLEMDVATELNMSRTPVREAMIRLQREGLLEVIPRHGMRVLPVSPNDMRELYQVLTALECMAAELLALRQPSNTDLMPLIAATTAMDEALKVDDLDGWAVADERFHAELVDLSGNRQLKETVLNYWDRAHRARMFTLRLRPKPLNSTQEHRQMVECFLAGDVKGATEITRSHRERANRELVTIFERYKLAQM